MAHFCPDGYIPLAEAFEEALSALENRDSLLLLISDAKTEDESDQFFINLDVLGRRVERLMRDALADGLLPANCALSVDSDMAVVEALPTVMIMFTRSK